MKIQLIKSEGEHIEQVIELGDKNTSTLGHLPYQAYHEYARKGGLVCALDSDKVIGYVLLRQNKKENLIKISHLCVHEDFRSLGLADKLLGYVKGLFKGDYRGIALNCRKDYSYASDVWRRNDFYPVKEKAGRGKKEDTILLQWFHDFGNRDLFSNIKDDKLAVVVDVNIIIQLRDSEMADEASSGSVKYLFSDSIGDEVKYYHANESFTEIARDSNDLRRKNTRRILSNFHKLDISGHSFKEVYSDLCRKYPPSNPNDESDRKQVAEAIANNISVFVTTDENLISSLEGIDSHYGIQLFNPVQFIVHFDALKNITAYLPRNLGAVNAYIKKPRENEISSIVQAFHRPSDGKRGLFYNRVKYLISRPSSTAKVIEQGEKFIGFIVYDSTHESIKLEMVRFSNTVDQYVLFNQIINELIQEAIEKNLPYFDVDKSVLDEKAEKLIRDIYFVDADGIFRKFIHNKISTWPEVKDLSQVKEIADTYGLDIHSDSLKTKYEIERAIYPGKILDLEITNLIIPIKPYWASQLFDSYLAGMQLFGAPEKLIWNRNNIYYRAVSPNIEKVPSRILWYISNDKKYGDRTKGISAMSYLEDIAVDTPKSIFERYKKLGIYEWADILRLSKENMNKNIKAIEFSDTELFKQIIPLSFIQEVLQNRHTFQGPIHITNEQFFAIYSSKL